MATQTQPGSVQLANPQSGQPSNRIRAFRFSTQERTQTQAQLGPFWGTTTATNSTTPTPFQIQGDGYAYDIALVVQAYGGTGATTNAIASEDFPYNTFDSIGLRDPGADIVSAMPGMSLHVFNLMQGNYRNFTVNQAPALSEMGEQLGGPSTTGQNGSSLFKPADLNGNFFFVEHLPIGLNLRTLTGILGNQDRAYILTVNCSIAAQNVIFSTAPAGGTFPSIAVTPNYRSFTVPDAQSGGVAQQRRPDNYGVIHLGTSATNAAAPSASGQISHYLVNLGPTFRSLAWIFRSASSSTATPTRANVELQTPTALQLFWGSTGAYVESWQLRRTLMYERLGYQAPAGVLIFDYMSDASPAMGFETGASYINTQNLVNSRLLATYPSTGWAAGSTLTQVVDSLDYTAPAA